VIKDAASDIWHCVDDDGEVWDNILHKETIFCLENNPSEIELVLRECMLEANAEASARFERARSEARTSCGALFEGHRLDRIAGNAEEDCREERKKGPPNSTSISNAMLGNGSTPYPLRHLI